METKLILEIVPVVLLIWIFTLFVEYLLTLRKLPPGPPWLSTIISNPMFPSKGHKTLKAWKDKYGDIICLSKPDRNIVIVCSEELIKEVLVERSETFSGRPYLYRTKVVTKFHDTVSFTTDGAKWRKMKKSLMTALKMCGEGLENLEAISLRSIQQVCTDILKLDGKPFDADGYIGHATADIISSLVCSVTNSLLAFLGGRGCHLMLKFH